MAPRGIPSKREQQETQHRAKAHGSCYQFWLEQSDPTTEVGGPVWKGHQLMHATAMLTPIICRPLLSCPQPLKPPANASSTLQLHSPIICRALLSCPRPLHSPANASRNLQLHSPIELRTPKNPRKAMPQSRRGSAPHTRRTRAVPAQHTLAATAPHQAFRRKLASAYFSSRHAHARTLFATFRNSEVSLLNFLW